MRIRYADGTERTPDEPGQVLCDVRVCDGDDEVVALDDEAADQALKDIDAEVLPYMPREEERRLIEGLRYTW